jgi:hypothetical protein
MYPRYGYYDEYCDPYAMYGLGDDYGDYDDEYYEDDYSPATYYGSAYFQPYGRAYISYAPVFTVRPALSLSYPVVYRSTLVVAQPVYASWSVWESQPAYQPNPRSSASVVRIASPVGAAPPAWQSWDRFQVPTRERRATVRTPNRAEFAVKKKAPKKVQPSVKREGRLSGWAEARVPNKRSERRDSLGMQRSNPSPKRVRQSTWRPDSSPKVASDNRSNGRNVLGREQSKPQVSIRKDRSATVDRQAKGNSGTRRDVREGGGRQPSQKQRSAKPGVGQR